MNQRPTGLSLSKATVGFLQYKSAEGLSPVTVSGYDHDLKLWIEFQGDVDVAAVETTHILAYLNHLRTDYVPPRITGNNDKKLSPKTVYNLYISVASFFTWASREFQIHNPVKGVPRPRVPEDAPVEPLKKEEIELLIKACDFCEEAVTDRRRKFIMQRSISKRDKAILLTLLDTGLRAGELCALRVGDVDMKTEKFASAQWRWQSKGRQGASCIYGKVCSQIRVALPCRARGRGRSRRSAFPREFHRAFNRDALRQIINSLETKVGIKKCHPHRSRHTFAITYLRSGGDIFCA
jgi:integrase/recombinase XerD